MSNFYNKQQGFHISYYNYKFEKQVNYLSMI